MPPTCKGGIIAEGKPTWRVREIRDEIGETGAQHAVDRCLNWTLPGAKDDDSSDGTPDVLTCTGRMPRRWNGRTTQRGCRQIATHRRDNMPPEDCTAPRLVNVETVMNVKLWSWSSVAVVTLSLTLTAQSRPAFEAVSIKKVTPPSAAPQPRGPVRGKTFYRSAVTTAALIEFAYDIGDFELVDAPEWTRKDLFEVIAVAGTASTGDEKRPLVRSLLEDRFHLVISKAQREARYLALTVAKAGAKPGPKLVKCEDPNVPSFGPFLIPRGSRFSSLNCARMSAIVNLASRVMDSRVVDKTGFTGTWSYVLIYADPTLTAGTAASDQPVDPGVQPFGDAFRDQLGLKLEPARGPVDVLVVSSIEQPTEN